MTKLLPLLLTASLLLAVENVSAEEAYSKTYDACMDASGGVTVSMLDCIGDEYGRTDALLNRLWQENFPKLPAAARTKLRQEQRAWIKALEPECTALSGADDPLAGTAANLGYNDCLLSRMLKRVRELRTFFKQTLGTRFSAVG